MLGLTILRPEAPKENESFQTKRPILPESSDAIRLNHVTPPIINHAPGKPVVEQAIENAKAKGNDRLAELLAKAEEQAKAQAKVIERAHRTSTNSPPKKPKSKQETKEVYTAPQVLFTEADVCSDEEFIKRTLGSNLHDPEMKRLFYANGGTTYLDLGLLYAPAFDSLKRAKATAIRIKQGTLKISSDESEYKRFGSVPKDSKVYVAGLPTIDMLVSRENAEKDARERAKTELWMKS